MLLPRYATETLNDESLQLLGSVSPSHLFHTLERFSVEILGKISPRTCHRVGSVGRNNLFQISATDVSESESSKKQP